jgi:hypothetical protein
MTIVSKATLAEGLQRGRSDTNAPSGLALG